MYADIAENVKKIKAELTEGNPFGEKVALIAAIKTQTAEAANAAIRAGADAVAENKVQEFREKSALLDPCPQHFIGHLQTNKARFLIGKIALYHSCDRDELAAEISRLSLKNELVSDVLIQINIGREQSKGGYPPEEGFAAYRRLKKTEGLRVRGFMAMLPNTDDEAVLRALAKEMRAVYDRAAAEDENISYLSMGMSGDWRLCVECGSNMLRLGSVIFGARNYAL